MMKGFSHTLILGITVLSSDIWADELDISPSARYRFQQIDDDARGDATANTLKLRLSAQWQPNDSFSGFIQGDHVHGFNEGNYNSVAVTRATSPIPETVGTELNRIWLKYAGDNNWSFIVGRQGLNFDNERHVSSIEFWQNDQTYDALTIRYDDSINWNITYAYVNKVHRIFGDDAKQILPPQDIRFDSGISRPFLELGNHDHQSHLINAKYSINRFMAVTGYAYLLQNDTAAQLSSDTFGIRVEGAVKPNAIKYAYVAELAHQSTADESPWDYEGYYLLAEISAQYKSHQLALSHERLSENNGFAFATSLGNNHKFLGWADIFSSYLNADGVRDTAITYRGRKAKLRWRLAAHQFTSDSSGQTAGHELDLEVAYRLDRKWQFSLLASKYKAKNGIEGLATSKSDLTSFTVSVSYNL